MGPAISEYIPHIPEIILFFFCNVLTVPFDKRVIPGTMLDFELAVN